MSNFSTLNVGVVNLTSKARTNNTKKEPSNFYCLFEGCSYVFNRRWKLSRHICSHTGKRPFECNEMGCSKSYQCLSHLQRHVKITHLKLDRLPCTYTSCTATFTCKSSLTKHSKVHKESQNLQCLKCLLFFPTIIQLKKHKQLHAVPSNLLCQICQSGWSRPGLLRRHMRSHAILQCEFTKCLFVCHSRSEMRRHSKNEHPNVFICNFCNKSFCNKGTLRDHITTHLPREQRRFFVCPHRECVRAYYQKRNLRHHLKVFHKSSRYYCLFTDCFSSFENKVRLKYHILRCHIKDKKETDQLIQSILPTSASRSLQIKIEPQCILEVTDNGVLSITNLFPLKS